MATWDPGAAWNRLADSPTDGTSEVYGRLLGECPVAHIPAAGIPGGGELDYWGIFSFEEVAKAATDFGTFSSVTPTAARGSCRGRATRPSTRATGGP